jgi:putative aldouronate transport system substrate-binding protein
MKRKSILLTVALFLLTMPVFAGGGQQAAPAAGGPMEIDWLCYNQAVGTLANPNSEMKKLLEEKFNVKINLATVNIHDREQWNLYWASGNMPDFANPNVGSTEYFRLVDQGILRPIPDGWLDLYMPDWMNNVYMSIDRETVYKQISKDGNAYIIPYTGGAPAYSLVLRQDWLDNLGIKTLPKNTNELFEVLKRFTFEDPDGNGRQDTYGLHMCQVWNGDAYMRLEKGVVPHTYIQVNGKVVYTDTTDEYKNYLKFLREWFKAGVVDPESFIDTRNQQRQKFSANRFGAWHESSWWLATSTPGNLTDMIQAVVPAAKLVQVDPFPSPDGVQYTIGSLLACNGDGVGVFTVKCTDEKMKKIMEMRNELAKDVKFYLRSYYGVEGRDYDIVNGLLTPRPDAARPEYVTEMGLRQTFGITPMPYTITKAAGINSAAEIEIYDQVFRFPAGRSSGNDFLFGVNQAALDFGTDITTLSNEYMANVCLGFVDIDASFEAFKRSLYDAGLQRIIDEYQAGL